MLYVALLLFFFNDTATTEIYTLSLHDALPIFIPTASDRDRSGLSPSGPPLYHNGDRRRRERTEAHRSTAKAVGIMRLSTSYRRAFVLTHGARRSGWAWAVLVSATGRYRMGQDKGAAVSAAMAAS